MGVKSVLAFAHSWLAERLSPGAIVIDATVGNGVDTLFFAESVGRKGCVYGFDVQPLALERTEARLAASPLAANGRLPEVKLLLSSHTQMAEQVASRHHGQIAAVIFNLGYLPHAQPAHADLVITTAETTIRALQAALHLLLPGGRIGIVSYPGHEGGAAEAAAVEAWAASLPAAKGQALLYRMLQRPHAPFFIGVEKRR